LYTDVLDIPDHDFQGGFPGVTDHDEWFAIRYEGVFRVRLAGDYAFRVESDDGSRVLIDGKQVVENDGIHGVRSADGHVMLDAGKHQVRLEYFQGPRYRVALRFFVTPPGQRERLWGPDL
jgi:PA14 domain